jgi:hypothetical protein
MMNMFQLQERVKDFSKDQLVQEMQQPSGSVPPFLVLSELQRRTRMEQAFQADQAQADQTTVAQDAVNAAGVPQGGIADIAQAMAPQTDMGMNTGAAPMQTAPAEQAMMPFQGMPVQGMYDGGVVRMQPGGLTRHPQQDELDEALARLDAAMARLDASNRAALGPALPPSRLTSPSLSEGVGLPGIEQAVTGSRETPSLADVDRDIAPRVNRPTAGSPMTETDTLRETRRRGDRPIAMLPNDLDPRFYPMSPDALPPLQGPDRPTPSVMDRMADSGLGQLFAAGSGVALPQMGAEPIDPMQGPNMPRDPYFGNIEDISGVGDLEFGGLPDFMTDPSAVQGEPYTRVADLFGLGPAIDAIPRTAPMDPRSDLQVPDAGIAALLPPPAQTPLTTPTPPTGPQTGGGAGGSRGALDADRMLEQDKWLALAQFGLGLMASQAPSLGGAIGEAGTAALGQFGQARQAAVARDLEERKLQAAMARASSRGDGIGALSAGQGRLLSQYDTEIERLSDILSGLNPAATNEDKLTAQRRLPVLIEERTQLISSFSGIPFGALAGGSGAGNIRDVR